MAIKLKREPSNTAAFVHDTGVTPQVELLSADVFGSMFRGPNAIPAIDQGLWDDVFDKAFASPTAKTAGAVDSPKLHVVSSERGAKFGKHPRVAWAHVDTTKEGLSVEDAVALIKGGASAKFDETLEIAMNLGVDPGHADQMVRGVVSLPNGTGQTVRVAVFARGAKADEAKAAGADIVGAEDLMKTIQSGKIEFDRCIATPDMMPLVGRLGRILGPRNLMPNPKVGTVTMDVKAAVAAAKGGEVQFKVEKAGVIHAGIGKVSLSNDKLAENIRAFVEAVSRAKPAEAKGSYLKKVSLSSTRGPGVYVDLDKQGKASA